MTVQKFGVLALQGDFVDHIAMLEAVGVQAVPVRRAEELVGLAGIVIPGGESTTMSKLLVAFDLFDPLQDALRQGLPVLGSCAGMIMLASTVLDGRSDQRTFGALDMCVRRNAFGRQVDSFETDLSVEGVTGGAYRSVFIRAPRVESVGEGVEVLASVEVEGVSYPVAVRQGNAMAVSFHPEMTSDPRIHELFVRSA